VGSGFLRGLGGPLADGEVIDAAGLRITVMATPGHTADSVSFLLDDAVLTADTVLGRGTTVIDNEDAASASNMESLRRLHASRPRACCPATAPISMTWKPSAAMYLAHREERLDQVRGALDALGETPTRVRSSSTSTPTSTKSYGMQRSGACRPNSITYGASALGVPVARSRRSTRSCPPSESTAVGEIGERLVDRLA